MALVLEGTSIWLGPRYSPTSRIQFASNQSKLAPRKLDSQPSLKVCLSLPWVHPLSHISMSSSFILINQTSSSSYIVSLLQVHPSSHFSKFTHCLTSPSSPIVPLLQVHVHTLTLHGFHTVVNIEPFFYFHGTFPYASMKIMTRIISMKEK